MKRDEQKFFILFFGLAGFTSLKVHYTHTKLLFTSIVYFHVDSLSFHTAVAAVVQQMWREFFWESFFFKN